MCIYIILQFNSAVMLTVFIKDAKNLLHWFECILEPRGLKNFVHSQNFQVLAVFSQPLKSRTKFRLVDSFPVN
jgi:hypothetical protein